MAVNRLTDGMPVTTEWLNSLVDSINNVASSIVDLGERKKEIAFNGTPLGSFDVQVVVGTWSGVAPAGSRAIDGDISFSPGFKDDSAVVFGNTTFTSPGARKPRPARSAVSFSNISKSGCYFAINLLDDDIDFNAGKIVTMNYVAIGKKI